MLLDIFNATFDQIWDENVDGTEDRYSFDNILTVVCSFKLAVTIRTA
jgi:hypothetical protein